MALIVPVLLSLVNGVLISVLRLNALIVTLATVGIILGAITLWTGQSLSLTGQSPSRCRTSHRRQCSASACVSWWRS